MKKLQKFSYTSYSPTHRPSEIKGKLIKFEGEEITYRDADGDVSCINVTTMMITNPCIDGIRIKRYPSQVAGKWQLQP